MKAFFDTIRPIFGGTMTTAQVAGCEVLLSATEGLPITHRAYLLATAKHETAHTMQPITEYGGRAYFDKYEPNTRKGRELGNAIMGDGFRYRGRGYVQITGRSNYERASKALGLDLIGSPDLALQPRIAGLLLVRGCSEGWWTGRKLSDYLPGDYVGARRVVNGTDKADEIAAMAVRFAAALRTLSDPVTLPKPIPPAPVDPKLDTPKPAGNWLMRLLHDIFGRK